MTIIAIFVSMRVAADEDDIELCVVIQRRKTLGRAAIEIINRIS